MGAQRSAASVVSGKSPLRPRSKSIMCPFNNRQQPPSHKTLNPNKITEKVAK